MADLESIIASSIAPATETADAPESTTDDIAAAPEGTEAPADEIDASTDGGSETPAEEVPEALTAAEDELATELGLKPRADGKENRIPYSRVKKIIENKLKAEQARLNQEFEGKSKETTTKLTDYEARLEDIGHLENILFNDQKKFMSILRTLPGYEELLGGQGGGQVSGDGMPQPDYDLGNGTATYSPDGLGKLLQWHADQVEKKVADRYKPIEQAWQTQERQAAAMPGIRQQLARAATWDGWTENEGAILKVLQDDKEKVISLEEAYRQVVIPKLKADRNAMRAELLKELKGAPASTSTAVGSSKPVAKVSTEPRSLEDVIRDSIKGK